MFSYILEVSGQVINPKSGTNIFNYITTDDFILMII